VCAHDDALRIQRIHRWRTRNRAIRRLTKRNQDSKVYRDTLNQTASDWAIGVWRAKIRDNGWGIAAQRAAFVIDEQFKSAIESVYRDVFNRAPTAWEIEGWRTAIRGGASIADVRSTLVDDDRCRREIISAYQHSCGQTPLDAQIEKWREQLRNGGSIAALSASLSWRWRHPE
jgi:hypothetical protein